jgi:hypothetical protein
MMVAAILIGVSLGLFLSGYSYLSLRRHKWLVVTPFVYSLALNYVLCLASGQGLDLQSVLIVGMGFSVLGMAIAASVWWQKRKTNS